MSSQETLDLGCITNRDVIKRLVTLDGCRLLDVGCGNMGFTVQLAEMSAQVLAIDPDPLQAEKNRERKCRANIKFQQAEAVSVPAEDASMDGIFFAYSLHHIPADSYPAVFREVCRLLKPHGFLYVIEPTDCPLNQVMRLFHDEDRERAEAQRALQELVRPLFQEVTTVRYHSYTQYDSFDDFADRFSGRTFNTQYGVSDVRCTEVRTAFETYGHPDLKFESRKMAMCFKGLLAHSG